MAVLIITPTHDEGPNIVGVLERIRAAVPDADVLVVDDCSSDDTRELVRQTAQRLGRIRLEEREHKGGLGDAYRHGFRIGLEQGYDTMVEIDADHSHDPADIPLMLDIVAHGVDVVIGSRYLPGGVVVGWPHRRIWLSRWGNRYAAIALGLAINDATSGYRVYRADTLRRIDLDRIRADGYGFQVEMTYRAVVAGMRIVEVPITFTDRVAGSSKMRGRIVVEAFALVTAWGLRDALTLSRRRRTYRSS